MDIGVSLFFLHNIIATALLGYKFVSRKDVEFRNFGIALLLESVAFVIWSAAVILKPVNLDQYVTVGAVFFIISLVFLFMVGIQKLSNSTRGILITLSVITGSALFFARTVLYPSDPSFSPEGLFFFNLQPIITMIYIFGLSLTALPAINVVASKFENPYAMLIRYGFIVEVAGGIILITTIDTQVLYIIGWIMGAVYLTLWSVLLFNRNAWNNTG